MLESALIMVNWKKWQVIDLIGTNTFAKDMERKSMKCVKENMFDS